MEESHSWSSAPVLKTGMPQGIVSSNLTSSAKINAKTRKCFFVLFFCRRLDPKDFAGTRSAERVVKSWLIIFGATANKYVLAESHLRRLVW